MRTHWQQSTDPADTLATISQSDHGKLVDRGLRQITQREAQTLLETTAGQQDNAVFQEDLGFGTVIWVCQESLTMRETPLLREELELDTGDGNRYRASGWQRPCLR